MSVMAYLLVNKITFYLWLAASIHRSSMFMLLSALARNMVHEIKYNKTDLFLDIGRYDTVWHCKIHTSVSYLPMSRRRSVLFYFISWSFILSNFSITAKGEKLSRALWLSHCPVDLPLDVMGSNFSERAWSYLNYQIRLSKFNGASAVSPPKKTKGKIGLQIGPKKIETWFA